MKTFIRLFSFFFVFSYFCSIQAGIANIFSAQNKINICTSKKKADKDLICASHCILEQIENLNCTNEIQSDIPSQAFKYYKISTYLSKNIFIEQKINSPPKVYIF